jgi:three-Cys-motif partner protein
MTKTHDKYDWHVGSPPPLIDPHSIVKHQIVSDYLDRYVRVLLTNPAIEKITLSVIDGFAGGGEYTARDGIGFHDGSPLIAVRTLTETEALLNVGRTKQRKVDAEFFFVEKKPSNFDYLKHTVCARCGEKRIGRDIQLYASSFQHVLPTILERVRLRRGGERAIFLLDQYAYDQVPLALLREIFGRLRGAEVLLTFNIDSLITFLSNTEPSRRKLDEIGLSKYVNWQNLQLLKDRDDPRWRTEIQRQLADGIRRESGAAFSTIFFVTPAASPAWTYWLVHLSNVFKARDTMMELHWAHANHFSHFLEPDIFTLGHSAGHGSKLLDQSDLDLGPAFNFDAVASARCTEGLAEKLVPRIHAVKRITFGDLLTSLGNTTPATAAMVRAALNPAIQLGEIEVVAGSGGTRRMSSRLVTTDIIQPSNQPDFFLPHHQ